MTVNDQTSGPHSSSRRSAQLRLIGIIVLALGIGGAGMVYWLGTRSPDLSDDPSMLGFNKREERQMGLLYGKMGTLIEDWSDDLKRPGTQAFLIVGFSALVAGACFYCARLPDNDDKTG
jgi:hypothetical protein